ncbi:MAG TPA: hypothetical protein VEL81_05030 [Thermoplasmata archaeon]|nr:hypothetical protein [Thermoplasmata archaeon]
MDPSSVLLALEEQKKWRDRLKRIQDRIRQLDRKKATLSKELDRVHKKMADCKSVLGTVKESTFTRTTAPPIIPGR